MLGCLSSGVSGLTANNNDMSVIANNIANANTTAYKTQRSNFSDVLSQECGDLEIGGGVGISSISSSLSQGPLNATANLTDLAIDGAGYFIVRDASGTYYTRAGEFHTNKDGILVTPKGLVVQGWDLQHGGGTAGLPTDISISNITIPPKATENISMSVNLNANSQPRGAAFDPDNASETANYSSSLSVYDASGNTHNLTIYFRKDDTDQWSWYAFDGGNELAGQTGTLHFTGGAVDSGGSATIALSGSQNIAIDFNGTTQFGSDFYTQYLDQDGYEAASLKSISITQDGVVKGKLSNGRSQDLALIALADFKDPYSLAKAGDNLFQFTPESGQPIINPPGVGGKGRILSYSLEGSNVDLASEFVKMIVTQRAFQANARTITTADQMLTELVNLKR